MSHVVTDNSRRPALLDFVYLLVRNGAYVDKSLIQNQHGVFLATIISSFLALALLSSAWAGAAVSRAEPAGLASGGCLAGA